MTFLALVVALVLVQVWGSGERVQKDGWFRSWCGQVASMGVLPAIKLVLAVLVPAVLLEIVLDALHPVLFGLLWIAAAVVLLLYSFGRGDFIALAERYRVQCRSGDFEGAWLTARGESGWIMASGPPASPEEVHAVVERCLFFADWVPARLLAAAFAITGDFVGSRDELLRGLRDTTRDSGDLLLEVATAALGSDAPPGGHDGQGFGEAATRQNEALSGLLSRSAICWLVGIALTVMLL